MTAVANRTDVQSSASVPQEQKRAPAARKPVRLAGLRAPLAVKVVGAHVAVLVTLWLFLEHAPPGGWPRFVLLEAGLIGTVVYVALILVALRPVHDLESAATKVWRGDYGTRVDPSFVADHDVLRVGAMFNLLLDGLADDRARMRRLAAEVIQAGDRERAMLARELHDSTAQRLAAVLLQLGAAARDATDPAIKIQLETLRDEVHGAMDEVRTLSYTVHPRVLDDLGLSAALEHLGREMAQMSNVDIEVVVPERIPVTPAVASVLYRVAQEALHNVARHALATKAVVVVMSDDRCATVRIHDDGQGFDVGATEARYQGMGLFTMRERVELVYGTFSIESSPDDGTTVLATVPFQDPGVTLRRSDQQRAYP